MSRIEFARHAPLDWFEVRDNELVIGGRKVTQIVAAHGSTPIYVYDRSVFARKVEMLREVFDGNIELHYAIKANPLPELVNFAAGLVDGLDVASAMELEVALASGMSVDEISFAGPGKQLAELALAVDNGVVLNVESELEMERISVIAAERNVRARVAVRVNPDFQLKTSGMKMGGGAQQFGIDAERVPALLTRMKRGDATLIAEHLEFVGFHIYSGSQNLRPEALIEAQRKTVELALRLAESAPADVRLLNIGGGFGIPYFPGEAHLDLAPLKPVLAELRATVSKRLPKARLIIELGRYLAGECGVYLCRISDVKESRGSRFLITDGGLHHHLAASGNFGQVLRKNYPVLIANRVAADAPEKVSVVGPLCTPLDLLASNMEMAPAGVGDLVAVFASGAYGFTASPLGFLSHPPPGQLLA